MLHHGGTEDTEKYTEETLRRASFLQLFSVYSSVLSVPPW
jgi:hypothetical protein